MPVEPDHEARQAAALAMQLITTHIAECAEQRRETKKTLRWLMGLAVTGIIMLLAQLLGAWIKPVKAETVQEWIHRTNAQCCDHRDCLSVEARPDHGIWIVRWHDEDVPYTGPIGQSPGDTVACGTPTHIRCLFLNGGTS